MVFPKNFFIILHQILLNLKNYQKHIHTMMKNLKKLTGKH